MVVYIIDICVNRRDEQEHSTNLKEVLCQLKQVGLHLKTSKCQFLMFSIEYLVCLIENEWVHSLPIMVAILDAPKPSRALEFWGLLNYYGVFIPR